MTATKPSATILAVRRPLLVVTLLAGAMAVTALASATSAQTSADVETRDALIADQENLLNTYRCLFNVDIGAVPGACPNPDQVSPGITPPNPAQEDLDLRDGLIADQEALLNAYRCRFEIDTEIVPGGCISGQPASPENSDPSSQRSASIIVPADRPKGRCASSIASGVYDWEVCAWGDYWEDFNYNRALSDREAAALIEKIWAEVVVEGKAAQQPTAALVPAGSLCATPVDGGFIIGCYQQGLHHIRRLDSFLETLLHETAHALVAGHPTIQNCMGLNNNDQYQACVHNDIFRCVADYLYTTYAGIPPSGVCGTTPAVQTTPAPHGSSWDSRRGDNNIYAGWTTTRLHTMKFPYEGIEATLMVSCYNGTLGVFFFVESGYLAGQHQLQNRILGSYVFLPTEYFGWNQSRQVAFADEVPSVIGIWGETSDNMGAYLPSEQRVDFINQAVDSDFVLLNFINFDRSHFGAFLFPLDGAYQHIRPVTEECGWTWG